MRVVSSAWAFASVVLVLGCQPAPSPETCREYLSAKGFDRPRYAQVRSGETSKNINEQIPALLTILGASEMVEERPIAPAYTLSMRTGSSRASQLMTIQIGEDGYGSIQHVEERVFFHCGHLPAFAKFAFDESTIIVR
jgi:hypothetical protein